MLPRALRDVTALGTVLAAALVVGVAGIPDMLVRYTAVPVVTVPKLTGLPLAEANVRSVAVREEPSIAARPGIVLWQSPGPGRVVRSRDVPITLAVAALGGWGETWTPHDPPAPESR